MKAFRYNAGAAGDDTVYFEEVDRPKPKPGGHDILVAVQGVAVNPVDTKVRRGLVPVPADVDVLGWDAAGIVEAIGEEVTFFQPGDEVFYAGSLLRSGANAEYHLVDERVVGRKPRSLNFIAAAALPLTSLTAWELLFDRLAVEHSKISGGTLLVIGGAGGVGSILIQIARQLTGLTVIATASRHESQDWCRSLGAHHVIDHTHSLSAELAGIGAPPITYIAALNETDRHWREIAEIVAPEGKVGVITDHETLDATPLKTKSASLHWEMVFTRSYFMTASMVRQHEILNEISSLIDAGSLKSTLTQELHPISIETLTEAHRLVETGRMQGKVALQGF